MQVSNDFLEQSGQVPPLPSQLLFSLLSRSPYQQLWIPYVQRQRGAEINIRAVATYMAYELSESGHDYTTNQLKDRVRRALNGELMTDTTLSLFISAFGFTELEARELWTALVHHHLLNKMKEKEQSVSDRKDPSRDYTIVSSIMEITVSRGGFISDLEVTEVIQSNVDRLTRLVPLIESPNLKIELLEGGNLVRLQEKRGVSENQNNAEYVLVVKPPYPLNKGELHMLHYRISVTETFEDLRDKFSNNIGVGAVAMPKYNITLIINFEDPVPHHVYHCIWEEHAFSKPLIKDLLPSNKKSYSIHYPAIQRSFCGFMWEFNPLTPAGTKLDSLHHESE